MVVVHLDGLLEERLARMPVRPAVAVHAIAVLIGIRAVDDRQTEGLVLRRGGRGLRLEGHGPRDVRRDVDGDWQHQQAADHPDGGNAPA